MGRNLFYLFKKRNMLILFGGKNYITRNINYENKDLKKDITEILLLIYS